MGAEIKGLKREEKWEYPLEGLREAVVNAICHLDYASSANVQSEFLMTGWRSGIRESCRRA